MKHLLLATCVFLGMLLEWAWREGKRNRRLRSLPDPNKPIREQLSSSGRFKAVVYGHDDTALRVEVFRRLDREGDEPSWSLTARPSFADGSSLQSVVEEALRCASGDPAVGADFTFRETTEAEQVVLSYEVFVSQLCEGEGYGMCLVEYANDLMCRKWLEEARSDPAVVRMWPRVAAADAALRRILLPTKRCIHGHAPQSHFWFWGYPPESPELESELRNLGML